MGRSAGVELRPATCSSNWWVFASVCVYEKCATYLQRQYTTARVLSSSLSSSDTPMARGQHFLSWEKMAARHLNISYRKDLSPSKTLQHVCGNEECACLCKLSASGLLPLVCWLGWALVFCWRLCVFFSLPPPLCCTSECNKDKEKSNSHPRCPKDPC